MFEMMKKYRHIHTGTHTHTHTIFVGYYIFLPLPVLWGPVRKHLTNTISEISNIGYSHTCIKQDI